jgi:hypothetical protein
VTVPDSGGPEAVPRPESCNRPEASGSIDTETIEAPSREYRRPATVNPAPVDRR